MRWRRRLTLLFAPSLVLAWSCATVSDVPTADVDPTIPELDASWSPSPKKPGRPAPKTPIEVPDDAGADAPAEPRDTGAPRFPAGTPRAARGDIVITEIMFDPSGPEPANEWIEVWNGRSSARSLAGLTMRDGAERTHVIEGEVAVAPNGYVVLVRDREAAVAAGVPAAAIVYEYGAALTSSEGVQLSNGASGAVALFDGESEVTSVAYGKYQFVNVDGQSCQADAKGEWVLAPATPGEGSR
jgi:hypothetical protein